MNLLKKLEGLKAVVIQKEHYEAAEVITQCDSIIRSSHISSEYLKKENAALRDSLKMHLAGLAMTAMIPNSDECCLDSVLAEGAFDMAEAMIREGQKRAE